MIDARIGKGNLHGKGVFAARDFKKGEVVIRYRLKRLTEKEYQTLSKAQKDFVHMHGGVRYLYASPERYVNHSSKPNTTQDLKWGCDIAARNIRKGETITTDATKDDSP